MWPMLREIYSQVFLLGLKRNHERSTQSGKTFWCVIFDMPFLDGRFCNMPKNMLTYLTQSWSRSHDLDPWSPPSSMMIITHYRNYLVTFVVLSQINHAIIQFGSKLLSPKSGHWNCIVIHGLNVDPSHLLLTIEPPSTSFDWYVLGACGSTSGLAKNGIR